MVKAENHSKTIEAVLNKHTGKVKEKFADGSERKIERMEILKTPMGKAIRILDFTGKKLRVTKSVIRKGVQQFVKKGTTWEEIPAELKTAIHYDEADFI